MSLPGGWVMSVARPTQRRLRQAYSRRVDRYLGVDTVEEETADLAGYHAPEKRFAVRPFGWTSCWRVLDRLRPSGSDIFLDIGCGAGRMVCAAARAGYRSVIGVEITPEMAAIARRNVAVLRGPHAPCAIVEADASQYTIPDDVSAVFLYNPFGGALLDKVISNIVASVQRVPRRVVVAYANPIEHERVAFDHGLRSTRRMHLAWRPGADWRRTQAIHFYEVDLDRTSGRQQANTRSGALPVGSLGKDRFEELLNDRAQRWPTGD